MIQPPLLTFNYGRDTLAPPAAAMGMIPITRELERHS